MISHRFIPGITLRIPLLIATILSMVLHAENHVPSSCPPSLKLPPRSTSASTGKALIEWLTSLDLTCREQIIRKEFLQGNVPESFRRLIPLAMERRLDGTLHRLTIYVTSDYLTLGSDEDPFLIPMTPLLAQGLAESLDCVLPTSHLVDEIWKQSLIKLEPQPIPPSPAMITLPVFAKHNEMVQIQRQQRLNGNEYSGQLIAGHKKDVILSTRIHSQPNRVVIYGWHRLNGVPIQPVYSGHIITYADYSHGIRLVHNQCLHNGESASVRELLKHPILFRLLSNEEQPISNFYQAK